MSFIQNFNFGGVPVILRFILAFCLVFVAVREASAAHITNARRRCLQELQSLGSRYEGDGIEVKQSHQWQRNHWALKCGYMDEDDLAHYEKKGLFPAYVDRWNGGAAPWYVDAPCDNGRYDWYADCVLGCFGSAEKLQFGERWLTIEQAQAENITPTITHLAPGSTPMQPILHSGGKIDYFTHGPEDAPLLRIVLRDRKRLNVTREHPMLDAWGSIIPAAEVREGQSLLTVDGPVEVAAIERVHETKEVWNIRPDSQDSLSNVIVAEGFLTGSQRFQNEWADEAHRNSIRRAISSQTIAAFVE